MNFQYISDSTGKTTGVFIPISEWNELKNKYSGLEEEHVDIPAWHKKEVGERLASTTPDELLDFEEVMSDIENSL